MSGATTLGRLVCAALLGASLCAQARAGAPPPAGPLSALETRAAAGDSGAAAELAARLELGLGVAPDPARAMALFCRAAALGSRPATLHLAAWLLTDDGPNYDPSLAAGWLRRLQRAERGLPPEPRAQPPRCPTDAATGLPSAALSIGTLIENLAPLQGVDPALVKAIVAVESSFRSTAVSSAGAAGLMQLMPATARSLGVADRFDIEQNLRGGIAFIAHLLDLYRGNLGLALAAYNAGPAAVDACACVPNNGETVEYVNRVRSLYDSVMHRPRMGTAG